MATTVARLQAVLSANTRDFDQAMDRSHSRMGKVGKAAGIAGLAIAGGLAYGLKKSVEEGMEAERVQKRLAQAFKTAGLNIKPYAKSIEEADKATRKMGFSDEDAKNALGSLLVATKSYKKSREDLNVAMDIARFKNIDLLQATKMLTMAQAGSQRATKQLGLSIQPVTDNYDKLKASMGKHIDASEKEQLAAAKLIDKQATAAEVIDTVRQKLSGQAEAYSQTAAGAMERFKAQTQELEETLGKALLPALTSVTTALAVFAEWAQKHPKLIKAMVIALGALSAALLAARAAQLLMNLAVLANPYVAVGVALVALTILVIKYRNQIIATYNWAKDHYPLLAGIMFGPLGLAIAETIRHFDTLRGAVVGAFSRMVDIAQTVLKPFKAALGGIQAAVAGLRNEVHTLASAFGKVVDAIKWIVDNAKKIGGVLGGIGGAVGGAAGRLVGDASGLGSAIANAKAGGSGAKEGSAFNVGRQLWDEIGMGEKFGLRVTSGYRPGATTVHGTKSDHSYNPSKAVDMSGSPYGMAALFNALIGRKEIRQAFYDPLGSIFGGVRSSYREGGHSDHIHIAEYDKGGYLRPGWNLAYNGLGRPEQVGGDVVIPVSIGGEHLATVVFDMLRRRAKVFENRNGRPAFGS